MSTPTRCHTCDALDEARSARFEAQQERNKAMAEVLELRAQVALMSTPLSPEALQAIAEESVE